MSLFRQIFYSGPVNKTIRTALKAGRKLFPSLPEIPVSGEITVELPTLTFRLKTNPTNFLTREVFWKGAMQYEYTPLFMNMAAKVNVFIDIGANIGYYSILASRINRNARIISFEPSTGPLHFLKENVELNECENVTIHGLALGPDNGSVTFFEHRAAKYAFLEHQLSGTSNLSNSWNSTEMTQYDVPVRRLDDISEELNLPGIDLIKIDTEGTEHIVFSGATKIIDNFRPIIITEILNNKNEPEMEAIFQNRNYDFYDLEGNVLTKKKSLVSNSGADTNFLLVPKEKTGLLTEWNLPVKADF